MDIDSCNICGEDHLTEQCPELGLDGTQIEFDQLSTRARLTLPQSLQVVDNGNGLVGVVAKETIPSKTQFGPFEAKRTTHIFDDSGFFTLKLLGKDGATVCLDTTDENECNWLCLVRAAGSRLVHNCIAYQLGTNIFYNTTREIRAGEELQVWYAPHFARKLGKPAEPTLDTRVLLGHRIEPLSSDLFSDGDSLQPAQTDTQSADIVHQQTQDDREPQRGEIVKAFYCPRCGHTFSSQTSMVQHLREHVLANTQAAPRPPGKRGRGRPRIHPHKVPEYPRRGRGRPRKHPTLPGGSGLYTPQPGSKRKREEEEEDLDDSDEDAATAEMAVDMADPSMDDVDDMDKDYTPLQDITSSGRRIQPRRSRKGRNSWLCEDYVVSKIGNKVKLLDTEADRDVEDVGEDTDTQTPVVKAKTVASGVTPGKRSRGRPRKIKELVAANSHSIIEIINDFEAIENSVETAEEIDDNSITNNDNKVVENNDEKRKINDQDEDVKDTKRDDGDKEKEDQDKSSSMVDQNGVDLEGVNTENDREINDKRMENNDKDIDVVINEAENIEMKVTGAHIEINKGVRVTVASQNIDQENDGDAHAIPDHELDNTIDVAVDEGKVSETGAATGIKESGDVVLMYEESSDAMYGCVLCGEKFREEMDAVAHFMNHSRRSDKYKHAANSTDDLEETLNKEEQSAGTGNEKQSGHPCDICHQSFKSAQYLYRHMIMHTDIFNCIRCKKTFSRKDSLQKHVLKCCPELAENYRIYACELCARVFSTRTGHKKHMKKCESAQCSTCLKVFSSSQDLDTHTCRKQDGDDLLSGKFMCGVCPKTFQSMYYLRQHSLLHKKLWSCSRCGRSMASQEELEEHELVCGTLEAIREVGRGTCDKCHLEFNTVKAFREHYLAHSHPHQCDKCLRRFVKIGTLSSHDCQSAGEDFKCSVCSKNFKSKINLDRHTKEHGCTKYECSECNEQFNMKAHAKNHQCGGGQVEGAGSSLILAVSGEREVCHTCGKSFSSKSNLTKHLLLHGEKTHACPHCEKLFHLEVYLREHITCVHYKIYKYQCNTCGKMLKSKTGLIAHNKLFHSTETEAHPCPKCGKVFKQKGNLRTHMFSHSTERKFSCTECLRSFKYPDQLSRHKLEHKHVNKLACPECDKTFYRGYEMKKHMQTYHSGYVYVCAICSSRCGHRHTLVRHFKRKHPEDFSLLSQEGYIDGMLKHVNDLYPQVALMPAEAITMPVPDTGNMTVTGPGLAQNLTLQGQNIILRDTPGAGDHAGPGEMGTSQEVLSRDAAEALHSLALGTVTASQYQLLKDKGLFEDTVPGEEGAAEPGTMVDNNSIVSEGTSLIQPQEVLQQEQVITDDVTNLTSVAMDTSVGMVQNTDGTISIRGLPGMPQSLEGLETGDGQIVILQIVDPDGQDVSGLVQGEIIQQLQTGGIIAANQQIIAANQEIIEANQEEIIAANQEILAAGQVEVIETPGDGRGQQLGEGSIDMGMVEQGLQGQGQLLGAVPGGGADTITTVTVEDNINTSPDITDNHIGIQYLEIQQSDQQFLTESSETNVLTADDTDVNSRSQAVQFIDSGEIISDSSEVITSQLDTQLQGEGEVIAADTEEEVTSGLQGDTGEPVLNHL